MLHGLKLAWNSGFRSMVCYTDSLNVLSLIKDPLPLYHKYAVLVQAIHDFMRRDWEVIFPT